MAGLSSTRLGPKPPVTTGLVKDAFTLTSLLACGAILQLLLLAILPRQIALLPAAVSVLWAAATTTWQVIRHPNNTFTDGVVTGRTTARAPARGAPDDEGLVVFHFGVRFNHPLGTVSPYAQETIRRFKDMAASLSSEAGHDRYGMLGMSTFRGSDRPTNNTLLFVFYFRDLGGLRRFAHDPLHKEGWSWLDGLRRKGITHIAAFHETFVVQEKGYETIYLDSEPTLLGRCFVKSREQITGDHGDARWQPCLEGADDDVQLKSMMGRMGRDKH